MADGTCLHLLCVLVIHVIQNFQEQNWRLNLLNISIFLRFILNVDH